MTKTKSQLLGLKTNWAVIDEDGKILETFKLKTTATQSIPRLRFNRYNKLKVVEVKNENSNSI